MNAMLARGEPLAGPRQKSGRTFGAVAEEVIQRRSSSWHGKVSSNHWRVSIQGHCAKLLDRQIDSIGLEDVLAVLRPLHDRAANFAAITRARVEDIFDYAQARGLIPADKPNPADRRRLKLLLPTAPAAIHRPALAYADMPALVAELRAINIADGRVVAARALEFAIITALGAQEAYRVTMAEIDFDARLLTVPAARMKGGKKAHVVPLSARAIEIVRELEVLRGQSCVVFPSRSPGDRSPVRSHFGCSSRCAPIAAYMGAGRRSETGAATKRRIPEKSRRPPLRTLRAELKGPIVADRRWKSAAS